MGEAISDHYELSIGGARKPGWQLLPRTTDHHHLNGDRVIGVVGVEGWEAFR
jgi:hypothetical protein